VGLRTLKISAPLSQNNLGSMPAFAAALCTYGTVSTAHVHFLGRATFKPCSSVPVQSNAFSPFNTCHRLTMSVRTIVYRWPT
jgi:hypothetical protein